MARAPKTHKDVEFMVDSHGEHAFGTFDEGAAFALSRAISHGMPVNLDVVIYSRAGARWYGGDDAVDQYEEDPEASVFERFAITVNPMGRIP